MPTRKSAAFNAATSRSVLREHRSRNIERIIARREALMAEAAGLREPRVPSSFTAKIEQLLTRWWSPASWQAREDLLKTAEWLISLEKRATAEPAPERRG